MEFGDFKNTPAVNLAYTRIKELQLESYVLDIEAYGFTVIPPDKVAPPALLERIQNAVLRIAQERTGEKFSLDRNGSLGYYKAQPQRPGQMLLFYLLMADRIFEEWVLNPTLYAMMDYMMYGQQQLSSVVSFVKWKGGSYGDTLGLHADSLPDRDGRMSSAPDAANAAYCLTDYTQDNGALAVVPGSHRACRQPTPGEGEKEAVPVECPAGSLIVWHGNLWHGAYPKKTDGLRLNLSTNHCNRRVKNEEGYQWRVPQEMLDRNPPEFARLVAADNVMGWDDKGPDYSRAMTYSDPMTLKRLAEREAAKKKTAT